MIGPMRWLLGGLAVLAALFIGFRLLDGASGEAPTSELEHIAEELPRPDADAREISVGVTGNRASITYRLPLTSNPRAVAHDLATKLEDDGWDAGNPELSDGADGALVATFTATRDRYRVAARTVSESADFTVTMTVAEQDSP